MKNLDKLERVLEGIWSGELEHNQGSIKCGSARCVCGWYFEFYFGGKIESEEYWLGTDTGEGAWDWSAKDIGLSRSEAFLLFDSGSTKSLQKLVLEAFKKGKRLNDDHFYGWDLRSHGYENDFHFTGHKEVLSILEKFLNYERQDTTNR